MTITIFNAYYSPEVCAGIDLEEDIVKKFSHTFDQTIMYAPTPSRGIPKNLRQEYRYKKLESLYNGKLKIVRYNLIGEAKSPILRALRYFIQNIKQYHIGIKEINTDIIFAGSTPPTQGAVCSLIKRKLEKKSNENKPFVYNLQDIFPDSLVNAGMTKKGSFLYKIGRKIEDYTYKNADKIIVISESFKKNIMQKGVPAEKIAVIPNWVDTEKIKPVSRENNTLFEEFGIDRDKFIVLYAGNFGASQGTDVILNAAELLKAQTDIQFVLFGGGSEFEKAKNTVAEKNLTNVIINPLLPAERISEVYSIGDVALITCKAGVGGAGMPSKTWNIMACGTPIIASFDTDSELAEILKSSNAGICIEPENYKALSDAITKAKNNSFKFSNGRDYVLNNADKHICLKKYATTIQSLLNR